MLCVRVYRLCVLFFIFFDLRVAHARFNVDQAGAMIWFMKTQVFGGPLRMSPTMSSAEDAVKHLHSRVATIVLATVNAKARKSYYVSGFLSLILDSYLTCYRLYMLAVKGGPATDDEIKMITHIMQALGFKCLNGNRGANDNGNGGFTSWSWKMNRPQVPGAKPFAVALSRYTHIEQAQVPGVFRQLLGVKEHQTAVSCGSRRL